MLVQHYSVVPYKLIDIVAFFRSVAVAVAFQRHLSLEWKTYQESTVINAFYTVAFWKEPPGSVEVNIGTKRAIDATTKELHLHYVSAWLKILFSRGPAAANKYTDDMLKLREAARAAAQSAFSDASKINAMVAGELRTFINELATVRLAATVGVAVIGGAAGVAFASAAMTEAGVAGLTVFGLAPGATAFQFGVAGLCFSATNSVVKSYEQGPSATVAAVSVDAGKYVANEASGRIAGHYLEKALEQTAENSVVIHYALGEISRWSAILSDTARLRARTRYKATRELAKSEQAFSQAVVRREAASNTLKTAGRFARGIPVVFAAWDIWDAWGDYMATQTDAGAH